MTQHLRDQISSLYWTLQKWIWRNHQSKSTYPKCVFSLPYQIGCIGKAQICFWSSCINQCEGCACTRHRSCRSMLFWVHLWGHLRSIPSVLKWYHSCLACRYRTFGWDHLLWNHRICNPQATSFPQSHDQIRHHPSAIWHKPDQAPKDQGQPSGGHVSWKL